MTTPDSSSNSGMMANVWSGIRLEYGFSGCAAVVSVVLVSHCCCLRQLDLRAQRTVLATAAVGSRARVGAGVGVGVGGGGSGHGECNLTV
jgi:hypothetical protein